MRARLLLTLLMVANACTSNTGVHLDVQYAPGSPVKYLEIQISDASHALVTAPVERTVTNADHSLVDLIFGAKSVGQTMTVRVDALGTQRELLGSGQTDVKIVAKKLANATVVISMPVVCGDGTITPPYETCDDGNTVDGDGCNHLCQIETGATCSGTTSACSTRCGDGIVGQGEMCDDGNTASGDGCSAICQFEEGWVCTSAVPNVCGLPHCGDGHIDPGEQCDDGNMASDDGCSEMCRVEGGFTCNGGVDHPSVCQNCGNGIAEGTEVCDGPVSVTATCWSFGFLKGSVSGLASCVSTCDGYDTSDCGSPINSEANINAAIQEAQQSPRPELVAIQPGDYQDISAPIALTHCPGPCSGAYRITVQPLSGPVSFSFTSIATAKNVFEITGEGNTITGLTFRNGVESIVLTSSVFEKNNIIRANRFLRDLPVTGSIFVHTQGTENQIVANQFVNTDDSLAVGVFVDRAPENEIAMNVMSGAFSSAIKIDLESYFVSVDQNSIRLNAGVSGQVGVRVDDSYMANICIRNNIVTGTPQTSSAYSFPISESVTCSIPRQKVNDVYQSHCDSASGLCDLTVDPGFTDDNLCLAPGNSLIDAGVDIGYDLVDDTPDLLEFEGTAPDLGARESGTTRSYGGVASTCP